MTEENGNRRDRLTLSPPSFPLPDDMDDYELWTVRLPTSLNIEALQGVELDTEKLGTFQAENMDYGMTYGHAVENEHFRLLVRNGDFLHPHDRPFDRHVNIVNASSLKETVDTELAPRLETAPPTVDPVRKSYAHIPQASGLKRRWMPPGTSAPSTTSFIAPLTRTTPKRSKQQALALSSAAMETNGSAAKESNSKGTNGIISAAAEEPDSMETNDGEPPDTKKRFKHEDDTPVMNGGDTRTMTKEEKKAAKKARKKEKKERKREKKETKKAKG